MGAVVCVAPLPPEVTHLEPDASVAFDILFEDDELLVVDKPGGMVVHPSRGHSEKTLVHGLLARGSFARWAPAEGEPLASVRPGIVHRLDKGTSGMLVVAKTSALAKGCKDLFARHAIERAYLGHRRRGSARANHRDVARASPHRSSQVHQPRLERQARRHPRARAREATGRQGDAGRVPFGDGPYAPDSGAPLRGRGHPHSRRSALRAHPVGSRAARARASPRATSAPRGGARLRAPGHRARNCGSERDPPRTSTWCLRRCVGERHVVAHERRVAQAHQAEGHEPDSTANHKVAKRTKIIAEVAVKGLTPPKCCSCCSRVPSVTPSPPGTGMSAPASVAVA